MEHTKGKWAANGTVIQDENGYPVAQVWPNTKVSSKESVALMKTRARLIAAAPKLLEGCKAAVYILKRDTDWAKELREQPWYQKAENAIAEAESER